MNAKIQEKVGNLLYKVEDYILTEIWYSPALTPYKGWLLKVVLQRPSLKTLISHSRFEYLTQTFSQNTSSLAEQEIGTSVHKDTINNSLSNRKSNKIIFNHEIGLIFLQICSHPFRDEALNFNMHSLDLLYLIISSQLICKYDRTRQMMLRIFSHYTAKFQLKIDSVNSK